MHRVGYKTETQLSDIMESGKEIQELNRNLYPAIEPYSTGFLKVSDVHTIYWEQSGNPNGHVSIHCLYPLFRFFLNVALAVRNEVGYFTLVLLSILFIFCSRLCFFMGDLEEEQRQVIEDSLILNFIGSFYLIR